MAESWLRQLRAGRVLLLDGGTGTELRRRGVALDRDAWSAFAALTHVDLLRAIHADYIRAGADVITTNTFATSRFVLEAAGHGAQFGDINRRAVAAAREARDTSGRDISIAGSMSCLPPRFDAAAYPDAEDESAAYRELAELLAAEGVDFIALEMLEDAEHAARACAAVRATGLPFWVGVTCRLRADGALAAFDFPGTKLSALLDALLPFEPDAVNVMHSPPSAIVPALHAVHAAGWRGIIGAYPTLEEEDLAGGGAERTAPEALAKAARDWVAAGARIVGGCCGTTPEHVRALRAALDAA